MVRWHVAHTHLGQNQPLAKSFRSYLPKVSLTCDRLFSSIVAYMYPRRPVRPTPSGMPCSLLRERVTDAIIDQNGNPCITVLKRGRTTNVTTVGKVLEVVAYVRKRIHNWMDDFRTRCRTFERCRDTSLESQQVLHTTLSLHV